MSKQDYGLPKITNPYIQLICDAIEASSMNMDPTKGMFVLSVQYIVAEQYGQIEAKPEEIIEILKTKVSLCFGIEHGFHYLDGPFDETSEKAKIYIMIKVAVEEAIKNKDQDLVIEI